MNWLHHILSRNRPCIPEPLWRESLVRLPFLQRLAPNDLDRLKDLSETLLDRKTFTSAAGFELTDEKAVLIAVQAAVPVLNLNLDLYADMAGIIVYPSAFVVPQQEMDEAGVIHEWRQPVSGEAIDAGGAVVLSWEDAEDRSAPGYNVVIHEFVHKIDMADGSANGCPPFLAAFHADIDRAEWRQVFSAAYADFLARVEAVEAQLEEALENESSDAYCDDAFADLPFDPYAAEHPAEFFAVASEAFFVLPDPLAADYPEVYRLLSRYYRQDPLASSL